MLRIVLDTNLFISVLTSRKGTCAEVFSFVEKQEITLLMSQEIIDEIKRVLQYKKIQKYLLKDKKWYEEFLQKIVLSAEMIDVQSQVSVIKDDPSDDMFLACAIDGKADIIISGDRHLLNVEKYQEIIIMNPRTFLTLYRQSYTRL